MKCEPDLIRALLLKIEDLHIPPATQIFLPFYDDWFRLEGFEPDQVMDNLRILYIGRFVDGAGLSNCDFAMSGLTWKGTEFLANVRNPEVWTKTKAGMKKVGGVGLDIAVQMAKEYAKKLVGEGLGLELG